MRPVMLFVSTACALFAADGPSISCKPVKIASRAEWPASSGPSQAHPRVPGFEITYLVEADGLMGFKDGSLAITAISTPDGKNIATMSDGRPTWKQRPAKRRSSDMSTVDEESGTFTIELLENVFGKTDGLNVSGSIVAFRGDHKTRNIPFSLGEAKVDLIDGLRVSLVGAREMMEELDDGVTRSGVDVAGGLRVHGHPVSLFSAENGDARFGVNVVGDLRKVLAVVLRSGDTRLDELGSIENDSGRTVYFSKPTGDNVTLEITYWHALEEVTVPIGETQPY